MPNRVAQLRAEIEAAHPGAVLRHRGEAGFSMRLADGTEEHRYTTGPWHWQQPGDTDWREIDTDLEARPDATWKHGVRSARFDTLLADSGRRRFVPRRWIPTEYVEFGALQFRRPNLTWASVPTGVMSRVENRLVGSDLTDGRLEVEFNGRGCRTSLVLKRATMARPIRWQVTLVGLTWRDGVLVSQSDAAEVGFIRPPSWSDASEGSMPHEIPWVYSGGYMTLTPDFTGAVYPITVDPDYSVAANADDGWAAGGSFDATATQTYAGLNVAAYYAWFRFINIAVAKDTTPTASSLKLVSSGRTGTGTVNTKIYFVDEDDHAAPTDWDTWLTDHGIHTSAAVDWDFTSTAAGTAMTSADCKDCATEVFARASWVSGADVGVHVDNDSSGAGQCQNWATLENTSYTEPILSITLPAVNATVTPAAAALTLTAPAVSRSGNAGRTLTAAAFSLTAPQGTRSGAANRTATVAIFALTAPAVSRSGNAGRTLTAGIMPLTAPQVGRACDANRTLTAAAFILTAPQATAGVGCTITLTAVSFPVTAPQVGWTANAARAPPAAAMPLTAPQVTRAGNATVTLTAAVFALTAPQATVVVHAAITLTVVAMPLTAPQVGWTANAARAPPAAAFALTAPQVTVNIHATVVPTAVAFALTAPQAVPSGNAVTGQATAAFTLTAPQVAPSGGATVIPAAAAFILTAPQATPAGNATVTPAAAAFVLTAPQSVPLIHVTVYPAAAVFTLVAPQVGPTGDASVTLTAAAFTLTAPAAEAGQVEVSYEFTVTATQVEAWTATAQQTEDWAATATQLEKWDADSQQTEAYTVTATQLEEWTAYPLEE